MILIILALISFPLLGYQFFGGVGFIVGLIAAILFAVMTKYEKKVFKKMDESVQRSKENVERIKTLKAEGKPLSKWEAAIRADTERRKQKKLEKKLAKQQSKSKNNSTS